MQTFLLWILKAVLSALNSRLDSETQAQVDDYYRRRDELEKHESDVSIELGKLELETIRLEESRKQNETELGSLESEIGYLEGEIRRIKDERERKSQALHNLSDDDVLRGRL